MKIFTEDVNKMLNIDVFCSNFNIKSGFVFQQGIIDFKIKLEFVFDFVR
jgi:hypothetical protein